MPTTNVTAGLQGRVGNFQFNIGLNGWLTNVRNASTGTTPTTFTSSNSKKVNFLLSSLDMPLYFPVNTDL